MQYVCIGYFEFSGILVYTYKNRSDISILQVEFGYFKSGFEYFGSGLDI